MNNDGSDYVLSSEHPFCDYMKENIQILYMYVTKTQQKCRSAGVEMKVRSLSEFIELELLLDFYWCDSCHINEKCIPQNVELFL